MHDLAVFGPHQNPRAGLEGAVLVHKVEKEKLAELVAAESGQGINLSHEVLMLEDVVSVPVDCLEEGL